MQFVFGNNKSKYDLLYTDDKREDAGSVLNMLKIPFAPTEEFDVFGYMPFGANSNRPLFFHCQKDTEFTRSVYFLHGIYRELSSEYFFSDEYMADICAAFIDQGSFNTLREQPDGFSYAVKTNEELFQNARAGVAISEAKLKTIVYHLCQRQRVVLVMDDEAYDTDYIRGLMCTVFKYLPPSLRKICSFITGMIDTGSVEFLLNIIPRSMYKKDRNVCVDISADDDQEDPDPKAEKVSTFLHYDDAKREKWFSLFETVYYGRISTFKKQTFAEFLSYMDNPSREEKYDLLMDRFVGDDRYDESVPVPRVILKFLKPRYDADDRYKQQIIDQSTFDPYHPINYYFDGIITIRKLYLLGDQNLHYIRDMIESYYNQDITDLNVDQYEHACHEYMDSAPDTARLEQAIEKQFYTVLGACIDHLLARVKKYREWTSHVRVNSIMSPVLNRKRYEILTSEKMAALMSSQWAEANTRSSEDRATYRISFSVDFKKKAREILKQYNVEAKKQKELEQLENENRAVAEKFDEIEQYMKQALCAAEKETSWPEGKAKKKAKDVMMESVLDPKPVNELEEACNAYYPLLLESCSFAERFAEQRATYMAQHIICSHIADDRFLNQQDEILSRVADVDNIKRIASALVACGGERAGLCFPYIACYSATASEVINILLSMTKKQKFAFVDMKSAKKYMDQFMSVATARIKQDSDSLVLKENEIDSMLKKCKKLAETDSSNKLSRAISAMLQSFIKRIRAQQKKIRLPFILGGIAAGVLLVVGITVGVILLMNPSEDANNGADETSETIVETSTDGSSDTEEPATESMKIHHEKKEDHYVQY